MPDSETARKRDESVYSFAIAPYPFAAVGEGLLSHSYGSVLSSIQADYRLTESIAAAADDDDNDDVRKPSCQIDFT